jgi:hypothetical protein
MGCGGGYLTASVHERSLTMTRAAVWCNARYASVESLDAGDDRYGALCFFGYPGNVRRFPPGWLMIALAAVGCRLLSGNGQLDAGGEVHSGCGFNMQHAARGRVERPLSFAAAPRLTAPRARAPCPIG